MIKTKIQLEQEKYDYDIILKCFPKLLDSKSYLEIGYIDENNNNYQILLEKVKPRENEDANWTTFLDNQKLLREDVFKIILKYCLQDKTLLLLESNSVYETSKIIGKLTLINIWVYSIYKQIPKNKKHINLELLDKIKYILITFNGNFKKNQEILKEFESINIEWSNALLKIKR